MPLPRFSKHLIALHCIRFLNRHTPLPSLLKSHCRAVIKRSPSSVDKKSILPLPFIATDESIAFGGEKGPMDTVFPSLREPWVAFSFAKGTSAPGQKARSVLHKGSAAPARQNNPWPLSPSGCQRPSALHLSPCYSTESQRLHICRVACVLAIPNYTNLPTAGFSCVFPHPYARSQPHYKHCKARATTIMHRVSGVPHIWRSWLISSSNSCLQSWVGKWAKLRNPFQASTHRNQSNKVNVAVRNDESEEGWGSKTLC